MAILPFPECREALLHNILLLVRLASTPPEIFLHLLQISSDIQICEFASLREATMSLVWQPFIVSVFSYRACLGA